MPVVYGLLAVLLVSIVYVFVAVGSVPWPGGPQLQPEAARNLSLALMFIGLVACGLTLSAVTQGSGGDVTRVPLNTPSRTTVVVADTTEPDVPPTLAATQSSPTALQATAAVASPATSFAPTEIQATATVEPSPTRPIPATTAGLTSTSEPPALTPTASPTSSSGPTPTLTALPLEPRALIETVIGNAIRRANDAQAAAMLNGDETELDETWAGPARDQAADGVRQIRSRFVALTQVSWAPSGEGIRLLASTATTATYTTGETWIYTGTLALRCPNGTPTQRRIVETYPLEQYTLELNAGQVRVTEWRLGRWISDEDRTLCP